MAITIIKKNNAGQTSSAHTIPTNGSIGKGLFGAGGLFSNIGVNSVALLGSMANNSVKDDLLEQLVNDAIQRVICEKLLLISPARIGMLEYFVSYKRVDGQKEINNIYLRKRIWRSFVAIDNQSMFESGAKPQEFLNYLRKKKCKIVPVTGKNLENII